MDPSLRWGDGARWRRHWEPIPAAPSFQYRCCNPPPARTRQRIIAALLAGGIVGALLWLLAIPMSLPRLNGTGPVLATFDARADAPPLVRANGGALGEPAPAAQRAMPRPLIAPDRHIVLVDVPAAPVADSGDADRAGAAAIAGPGTAAGGAGSGVGAGGTGFGWAIELHARKIAGDITPRDYPRRARQRSSTGTAEARFTVGVDGRVTDCRIVGTSGDADLDTTTCRLIQRRWRYEPARDLAGRAVAEPRGWRQRWWFEGSGVPAPAELN